MRPLTPDEEQVIAHGATEPPFSGLYWNHKALRRNALPLGRQVRLRMRLAVL